MKEPNNPKTRVYQNGGVVLTEEEFRQVVDVFKTLLKWDKELKQSKEKQENSSSPEEI